MRRRGAMRYSSPRFCDKANRARPRRSPDSSPPKRTEPRPPAMMGGSGPSTVTSRVSTSNSHSAPARALSVWQSGLPGSHPRSTDPAPAARPGAHSRGAVQRRCSVGVPRVRVDPSARAGCSGFDRPSVSSPPLALADRDARAGSHRSRAVADAILRRGSHRRHLRCPGTGRVGAAEAWRIGHH